MQTLYELLGALPDDDADHLRAAFRNAAKASHPDNNPADADAALQFRRIVRAYAILRDERQRATYDSFLVKADEQRALISRRKIVSRIRNLVSSAVTATVIAFVSIGAFVLFERVASVPDVTAQLRQTPAHASALASTMPNPSDGFERARERSSVDQMPASDTTEVRHVAKEMTEPVALASADNTLPAVPDVEVKDARYYRERGHLAYRIGDLALALVDFDLAIELDPNFSDAYIDRAIVLRRMGDLKHSLADIAEAKRIEDQRQQRTTPLSGNK